MASLVMAQVTMNPMGQLEATLNPNLADKEKLVLACQCAEMFARLAAQGFVQMEELDKPKILVPQMGFRL